MTVPPQESVDKKVRAAGLEASDGSLERLHAYLMHLAKSREDADDLAQETFVRYYQSAKIHEVRNSLAYLLIIARNLYFEFRARKNREADVITIDSALATQIGEGTECEVNQDPCHLLSTQQLVNRLLMQIPPGYRKVLVMHKRDGMTAEQIAASLGLTTRSVQIYVARAMAYVRMARLK